MSKFSRQQSGIVLITGLVMLLLLTIVAITAMKVTNLEERMAGNLQNTNIAFQSAESALREAEAFIDAQAQVSGSVFNPLQLSGGPFQNTTAPVCVAGLCGATSPLQSSHFYSLLGGGDDEGYDPIKTATTGISTVYAEPKFIIELIDVDKTTGGNSEFLYAIFRITARAQGGDASSVIQLQSTYRQYLHFVN